MAVEANTSISKVQNDLKQEKDQEKNTGSQSHSPAEISKNNYTGPYTVQARAAPIRAANAEHRRRRTHLTVQQLLQLEQIYMVN